MRGNACDLVHTAISLSRHRRTTSSTVARPIFLGEPRRRRVAVGWDRQHSLARGFSPRVATRDQNRLSSGDSVFLLFAAFLRGSPAFLAGFGIAVAERTWPMIPPNWAAEKPPRLLWRSHNVAARHGRACAHSARAPPRPGRHPRLSPP